MMPLGLLAQGESAEIMEIGRPSESGGHERPGKEHGRMEDMGVRIGKSVEMLSNGSGGPLVIRVDESRIAIGRGMAMKILVRRKEG